LVQTATRFTCQRSAKTIDPPILNPGSTGLLSSSSSERVRANCKRLVVNHYPVEKFMIPLELPQNNGVIAWVTLQAGDSGQAWLRKKSSLQKHNSFEYP
jgi:hypothetical protein